MLRWLCLLAILFAPLSAVADDVVIVAARSPDRVDLRPHLAVLRDPSGTLDAAAVRAAGDRFEPLPGGVGLNFGYTTDALWLRLMLVSAADRSTDWRIELDYASLDHAELHDPVTGVQRAGDRLPWYQRALPHRNPVFAVTFAPGERRELLLRVASEGSLTVNPVLWRAEAFRVASEAHYALHALYFGMLLALAAYNLLLFVVLRDRAYIYYVLFVLSAGMGIASIYGLAAQFLWPDSVEWSNRALVVGFAFSGVVAPLFTRDFLGTAARATRWHAALAVMAWLHAAVLVVGLLAPMRIAMQAMSVSTLLNCVVMLGAGIACMLRGHPGARLFVTAWAALLAGGILMALRNFGVLPTHFITLHGMQVGSALEMLLLSFALAARFEHIKQETTRAQARALAAEQQRVALLERQERELEQRVAERTDALARANAQLRELAARDALTGLANRSALYARLDAALAKPAPTLALMLVDLDGFKAVNDSEGHAAGDRVLVEVAERLRGTATEASMVARLGGDEFVIVVEAPADDDALAGLAERLLAALSAPYPDVQGAHIGASIGIARAAREDARSLMRRADAAMYAAKAAGRGAVRFAGTVPDDAT
jgi:diguanylate cyclase (GGDEF)-like protein